jgi:S-adenosylmethionine:tRNA ribosyltransferase-isomerase
MIDFGKSVAASIVEKAADGSALLHFHGTEPVELLLERAGRMPPPPLLRPDGQRTRTIKPTIRRCSREEGAGCADSGAPFHAAAPGALDERGIRRETLTLHVGAGTFLPVKSEDTSSHVMHPSGVDR